jgi:Kdo2-lipid IVA lauroyltransferase/acyltransferase
MSLDNPTFGERLLWRLEAFGYDVVASLLRLLPVDAASGLGGALLKTLGPLTGADRTVRRNLELAFPDLDPAERDRIRLAHWEQFGRFVAEFPMLDRLTPASGRIEVVGAERLRAIAEGGEPTLMISGHFSNFEIMAAVIVGAGVRCQVSYRPANNPYFNDRVIQGRARYGVTSLAPKGSEGAREIMRALARGESVAMLIDQKFNAGVASPIFGHMAHTSAGPVRLAHRVGGKVTPLAVQRLKGARFRVTIYEPIVLADTGDREADTVTGVRQLNAFLEERIRERPSEWFWAHKRWPKSMYKGGRD